VSDLKSVVNDDRLFAPNAKFIKQANLNLEKILF
jgi:hypothetical protein